MLLLLALGTTAGCRKDETISGYADRDAVWRLEELGGKTASVQATLTFPEPGVVAGSGPCNTFRATQSVPLPWIEIRDISSTRRACPELDEEQAYFSMLETMTTAELGGDLLILRDDGNREMVLRAD